MLLAFSGCATIEMQHVNTTERVLKTERVQEQNNEQFAAGLTTSDDGTPIVTVRRDCKVWATDRVEVTDHKEAKNKSATTDWAFGISGGAMIGVGGWGVADASKTYPNDTSSRTYNPVGPDGERSAGWVTLGVGVVLLGVGVVDAVRANETSESVKMESRRRPEPVGTCKGKPASGVAVSVRWDGGTVKGVTAPLGESDEAGQLVIDLTTVKAPSEVCGLEQHPFGTRATVVVGKIEAGRVPLAAAYSTWIASRKDGEAAMWKQADSALNGCAKGGECTPVERFRDANLCYARTPEKTAKVAWALDEHDFLVTSRACMNPTSSDDCHAYFEWVNRQDKVRTTKRKPSEIEAVLQVGVPKVTDLVYAEVRSDCTEPLPPGALVLFMDTKKCDKAVDSYVSLVETGKKYFPDSAQRIAKARKLAETRDKQVAAATAVAAKNASSTSGGNYGSSGGGSVSVCRIYQPASLGAEIAEIRGSSIYKPGTLGAEIAQLRGDDIHQPGTLGEQIAQIRGNSVYRPGTLGAEFAIVRGDGIYRPGTLGEQIARGVGCTPRELVFAAGALF